MIESGQSLNQCHCSIFAQVVLIQRSMGNFSSTFILSFTTRILVEVSSMPDTLLDAGDTKKHGLDVLFLSFQDRGKTINRWFQCHVISAREEKSPCRAEKHSWLWREQSEKSWGRHNKVTLLSSKVQSSACEGGR